MKRLILSSLIGLMTTFGAFGVDSDTRNGLEKCLDNFQNDEDIVNFINNGHSTADGTGWIGLSELLKDFPTLEEQQAAIFSTAAIPEGYTQDFFKESKSTFARLYAALFLKYVATECPEYFIALSERFANDKSDESVRLHSFYKWEGEKIQFITKDEYDKTEIGNRLIGALSLESITYHLSTDYYFLALPKDTANIGEWLTYETGLDKLLPLKDGNCGGMWEMKNSQDTTDTFVIDGIDYINIHQSFPGLIVKFNSNRVPIVRHDNYGYTAINAPNNYIEQTHTHGRALSKAKEIADTLRRRGCNDMELYIATTDSPEGIVANTIQTKLFNEVVEKPTKQSKMTSWGITASVAGTAAAAGGATWGVTRILQSFFNARAEAQTTKTLAKAFTRKAANAKTVKVIARGVTGGGAIVAGVLILGGFALQATFEGLTKDLQPVDVEIYDQLYIMYKTPMNTANQQIKPLPPLESSAITIENTTLAGIGNDNEDTEKKRRAYGVKF